MGLSPYRCVNLVKGFAVWVVGRSANKQQKPKSFSQQSSAPSEAAPPCFSPCVYAGSYLVICELLREIVTFGISSQSVSAFAPRSVKFRTSIRGWIQPVFD